MSTSIHTPNDLRAASLEYLLAHAEPDPTGRLAITTPAGLEIELGTGWMSITGAVVESVTEDASSVGVDHTIHWNYTDPPTMDVRATIWQKDKRPVVLAVKWRNHNRVATSLMSLLEMPAIAAATV